jgi:hypothetical protein
MEEVQALVEKVKADIQDEKSEEEIFQSLFHFFGQDPEVDGRMVELLASIPHVRIAQLLHRLLAVSSERRVRKIIKRSLYRLKGKGIAIEEVLPEKERPVLHPLQAEPSKGFGSGIDSFGQRLLLLVVPHMGRGWTVMEGIVSDTQGWVDFMGEEMTRKGFKTFLGEVQKQGPFPLVEMEPSYVGFLFNQAQQLAFQKGKPSPQGYLSFKKEIEDIKKEYEKPLIYSCFPADEITGDDRNLRRAGDLLKADVFSGWRIEEDQIRPYADAVWEAEGSKIVLTPIQKEARFQEIYQKALSELFSGERRFLYQRRLEEMAYYLYKLGREEEAKISLSAAMDLEKPLNPFQSNPFLFQLVTKSIFTLLAEAYEKKVKEPSLIVKP